jgi:4-hydroxybenzoate polyprenyltransferase
MSIGAELVSTALDAAGDGASGVRTVATIWGTRTASPAGSLIIAAAMLVAWVPVPLGAAGSGYVTALAVCTLLGVVRGVPAVAHGGSEESSRRTIALARTITVVMVLALAWDLLKLHRPGSMV